jgi:hypothetical protein
MELVKVYKYREMVVHGAKFPIEHPWIQELKALVPRYMQDNHQVVIFSVGEDSWGRLCEIAVYFHDFNAFIGSVDDIQEGY